MERKQRTVIIHCHLFKNAGTTFDWSLKRSFGDAYLDHRDDENMRKGAEYLGPFLERNPHIKALSSHHIRFPLPELADTTLIPAIILRHPIDRIGSVYAFERKQDAQTPGAVKAKSVSFREYVRWRMRPDVGGTIRNLQTRYCLDEHKNLISEQDFNVAKLRVKRTSLIGLVDRYAESMVLFENTLRPYFTEIDLSYIKQNISEDRNASLDNRVQGVLRDLGLEVANVALAHNHWDLMLYLEAQEIVRERLGKAGIGTAAVENFLCRCVRLRTNSTN